MEEKEKTSPETSRNMRTAAFSVTQNTTRQYVSGRMQHRNLITMAICVLINNVS